MKSKAFARFSWFVVAYTIAVILWGAYVRASGSGAGCGSHWPLCNGDMIPREPGVKTIIELTHRMTSGVALVLVVVMLVWALRAFPKKHIVRKGAALSVLFMLTEALVGAGLVLFELVADNASMARAMFMAVHLINTFALLAFITLTAWWSSGTELSRLRGNGAMLALLAPSLILTLVLAASGAIAALGDTLFPSSSLTEGLRQDFSATSHFLIQLRLLHPLLAVVTAVYLIIVAASSIIIRPGMTTKNLARGLIALVLIQMGTGLLNVALLAPIWLQIVHLLLADAVWVVLVLLSASMLAIPGRVPNSVTHPRLPSMLSAARD
ncbi:MAG TPA: COX15/CtaA family protein [Pyrinomonadaceae bacterium]|nr:COX15/CtaA family protein [Pyrinomonadaceae bacterium]